MLIFKHKAIFEELKEWQMIAACTLIYGFHKREINKL